jgi:hypothetical protein
MLRVLRANRDDLETLKSLQQLLCREIVRTEKKIRELKAERKATMDMGGRHAAKRSSILINRVEKVRHCAYVWRCFGDAIAFTFLDKFGLKQCFYSTEHTGEKQSAGFLSDESGLATEISWLEFALEQNTPALLSDLTDTIRHGDLCLLDGVDPFLIEVKMGDELDRRGRRQKRNLAKLQSFFENDHAEVLRGFANLSRQTFEVPERSHTDHLNACIADAMEHGHALRSPESGLHYVALTAKGLSLNEVLGQLELKQPWVFQLNEFKARRAWAPYYPFTLSIEDRNHLWAFVRGDLYLLVVVEQNALCQIARDQGYEAKIEMNREGYKLDIRVPGTEQFVRVSSHMLTRIGLEFMSPEWVIAASIELLSRRATNEPLSP